MSNPTSNFGWQMPTATDLVTDLPADFEVFGQAVDTALMDLKSGTTGQVLSKNSNTDMDFVWITIGTPSFVGCALTKTGVQSTSNNTLTTMTWDSENFDTDGFHDNATNNSRITIPAGKGGKYLFTGIINWNSNASGYREVRLTKNGTAQSYANIAATPTGEAGTVITTILDCIATDYVEIKVEQSSGGSLDVKNYSIFQCQYLGA
jgi:hypothetical protein